MVTAVLLAGVAAAPVPWPMMLVVVATVVPPWAGIFLLAALVAPGGPERRRTRPSPHDEARYHAAVKVSQEIVRRPPEKPDPWEAIGGPGGPQYPVGEDDESYVAM